MTDFLTAIALVLVIEGLCYAVAPEAMKRMVASVMTMPSASLRIAGLVAAVLGVALVAVIR